MTTTKLSNNAETLLAAIKSAPVWEENAADILFPKPTYSKENAAAFWQHETNKFGYSHNRPVNGVSIDFEMNIPVSYLDQTYQIVKELKRAGLIIARNCGYNTYQYIAKENI